MIKIIEAKQGYGGFFKGTPAIHTGVHPFCIEKRLRELGYQLTPTTVASQARFTSGRYRVHIIDKQLYWLQHKVK